MKNIKLLSYVSVFLFVIFALFSVSFGAEDLSQSEVDEIIKGVEKGDPKAQFKLGLMYYKGQNVKQDYEQAFYWFKKVAEQGYAEAQNNLGVMYGNGEGVKQDYEQASYWYKKAAEQEHAGAQNNLGIMYWNGEGVKRDEEQAFSWFKKAAENGDENAKNIVSRIKITFVDANQPLNTKAQQDTAIQIRQIEDALFMYNLHNGFYPSTEQGLQALITAPTTQPLPNRYQEEGYLKRVPNDAWGNPFVYKNYGKKFQIMSYGRDGKKGGEGLDADIANIEVSYEIKSEKQDNTKNITSIPATQSEKDSYIEIGIEQLQKEYSENKIAARRKYDWKKIGLSGFISRIDEDDDKEIYIRIKDTKDSSSGIRCYFNDDEVENIMKLKEGQSITIEGICRSGENMFGATIAQLQNCRIVNPKKEPQSSKPKSVPATETGHEAMIDSIYDAAQNLVKGKSPQIQKSATMEAFEGAVDLHLRLWTAEHYAVLMNYEDETWKKGYVVGFWTDDPSLIFAHELKVGTSLSDVQTFYNYQEEGDGTLYFSEDSSEWYSYLARSTVAFAIKDGNVQSIRYVGLMTDIPPEIKQAITGTIIKAEKAPLQKQKPATADEAEKNVLIFENSLEETTKAICWSGRYTMQDSEFVENVMDGIEDYVYMRAWMDEHYIVIRKYYDNSWSSSFTSEFWTDDPEFVFAGNLKVGSSFRDLIMFFGGRGMLNSEENPTEYTLLEEGFWITFNLNDGFISSIEYSSSGAMITSKMLILCNVFRGQTLVAEVTGKKSTLEIRQIQVGKFYFK